MRLILLFLFLIISTNIFSIDEPKNIGTWNIVNIKYNLDKNWSFFSEGQIRSSNYFYQNFNYYEVKGGINYNINSNTKISLGIGKYETYKEGGNFIQPKLNDELRIWPQLIINQPLGKLNLELRNRFEFRFLQNEYRNRFRYRVGLIYPLSRKYDINVSDEIFVTDKQPIFEKNRSAVSILYKMNKEASFMIGYLHQFDHKIDNDIVRNFLLIGLFFDLNK